VALEQLPLELVFQGANLLADRGLTEVEIVRGRRDAAGTGRLNERPQVLEEIAFILSHGATIVIFNL